MSLSSQNKKRRTKLITGIQQTDKLMEEGPLARLNSMLPRLERLLLERETPSERAYRSTKEFLSRKLTYLNDFNSFTHTNDPVIYNSEEGMVYCKICHFCGRRQADAGIGVGGWKKGAN